MGLGVVVGRGGSLMAMKPRVPASAIPSDFAANTATSAPAVTAAVATVAVTSDLSSLCPARMTRVQGMVWGFGSIGSSV